MVGFGVARGVGWCWGGLGWWGLEVGVLVFCLLCWCFVDLLCLLVTCGVGIIYFAG